MRRPRDEEPNYLARAKHKADPSSFKQLVLTAYQVQFGITKQSAIATIIGRSGGLVSVALNHPEKLESEAVAMLIAPLTNLVHKRAILRSWVETKFEIDLFQRKYRGLQVHKADRRMVKRISKLILEGEPYLAAAFATEAAKTCDDRDTFEQLLDLAFLARQRGGMPGHAMMIAKLIAASGKRHKDPWREAYGYFLRAQIMTLLPGTTPDQVFPLITEARSVIAVAQGHAPKDSSFRLATERTIVKQELMARLTFMERGLLPIDPDELAAIASSRWAQGRGSEPPLSHLDRARIHLLLGNSFKAEESLEKAFDQSFGSIHHAREICGIVEARLKVKTAPPSESSEYLQELSRNCRARWDVAHMQVVEADLAHLESSTFHDEPDFVIPPFGDRTATS